MDNEPRDTLKLRHNFNHNRTGEARTNVLKAYMSNGELQLYIDNGKHKDGKDVYAGIRLNEYQMKRLLEFVQKSLFVKALKDID